MSRPLRAVPDTPPRAVAYVRVSDERGRGEDLLSPEIQLTAIRDHCDRHGYQLIDVLEDVDLTGRLWQRRKIETAVTRVEALEVDVLVVWKISRVARNRRDWAIAVDRIEAAGGRLESATEPNDPTASGRFARGVLAELAAFESERIGEGWKETHARRVAAGRPANGKPRWGYTYDPVAKVHRPDPVTGPVLAEVYRRYVAGESIYSLVGWLNAGGWRTTPGYGASGGLWSDRTLRRCLDSGFAAGLLLVGGRHLPGAHDALIGGEVWQEYRASRVSRAVSRGSERSQYLLSGLVRCACGSTMTGGQFGAGRVAKLRCKAAHSQRTHTGGYVTMRLVEDEVVAWLVEVAGKVDAVAGATAVQDAARARQGVDARLLEREVADLDAQLVEVTRQHLRGVVPESAYLVLRDELVGRRDSLATRARAQAVASRRPAPGRVAADLLARWEELSVAGRRAALRDLIDGIVVTTGRPRAVVEIRAAWPVG